MVSWKQQLMPLPVSTTAQCGSKDAASGERMLEFEAEDVGAAEQVTHFGRTVLKTLGRDI